jgi:Outer membrane protein beta-barrel domain
MKKLFIIATAIIAITTLGIGSAPAADNSLKAGAFGFNVGFGDSALGEPGVVMISGKYFIQNDLALIAGFGTQVSSGDVSSDFYGFSAGVRKYLTLSDFAPFVGCKLSFERNKNDLNGIDRKVFDVSAVAGAEYFLQKQFSIEGSVGIGFGSVDNNAPDTDYTYFGTRTVGVSANFYF